MPQKEAFNITDFAKLARTTRGTLIYYDRIKLLSPHKRGESGYRLYSAEQASVVNIIRTAQQLGFSLQEIKHIIENRTPAEMDDLLVRQIENIDKKIDEWVRARKLLSALQQMIHTVRDVDVDAITVERLPAQAIILGGINEYSEKRDFYDELLKFYYECSDKHPDIDLNYPVWGIISEERIRNSDWRWPDRYYFYNPDGLDRRPGALYAIGYCRGGYGGAEKLYERLTSYIRENGYEISGPAYEEYPLNEMCVADVENYLIRVMIMVRKKRPVN